jgi:hypothetical protein
MLLDVLALVAWVAVAATGAWLLRVRLPRAQAAMIGEPVCLVCDTPARRMPPDSFLCPGCGRDVRERGLAVRTKGAFAGPFWPVVVFSAALCAVAPLVTSLLILALPRLEYISEYTSVWGSGQEYRHLEFTAVGRRIADPPQPRPLEGEVHADLFLTIGEVFTLEIQCPALRYRVLDTAGREKSTWSSAGAFDRWAVEQWMAAAGLGTGDKVQGAVDSAYAELHRMLGLPAPTPPANWRGSSGRGSSRSSHGGPPAYVVPAAVIVWSLAWLAGVWRILRRPPKTSPATRPAQGAQP